ncbi:MAG: Flagellin, partial [Planctomycetota bacterium]
GYHTLVITGAATQSSFDLSQPGGSDIWTGGTLENAAGGDKVQKGFKISINGATLDIASGTTKSQFIQQLNAIGQQVGFSASLITGSTSDSGDIRLIARDFGSSFSFDVQYVDGATGAANLGGTPVDGADAAGYLLLYEGANGIGGTATTGSATIIRLTGGTGLTLRSSGGTIVVLSSAVATGVVYGAVDGSSAGATFQVGANANQTATVELASVQASQLGIGGSGIYGSLQQLKGTALLVGNATEALKIIDKAINDVTVTRGNLGAFQANTLETAISSLRNTQENLMHAESTIRDVDFAAESAKFTKFNILVQSSTSMLAQANQLPQNVLKLLG